MSVRLQFDRIPPGVEIGPHRHGVETIVDHEPVRRRDEARVVASGGITTRRSAAINEMKSDISSVEETHRRHDVKIWLASRIVEERFGWRPRAVGRILVVPEETRLRRMLARHEAVFGAAYPASSREIRAWIREPSGPLAGVWFLSPTRGARRSRLPGGPRRIRAGRLRTGELQESA